MPLKTFAVEKPLDILVNYFRAFEAKPPPPGTKP